MVEAHAKSLAFVKNLYSMGIPFFQRSYVWGEDNWQDLIDEFLSDHANNFLGSIILKQERAPSGELNRVSIIDGQQRLTTISLLIKAIYDKFDKKTKENTLETIHNYLFYKPSETDGRYEVKIEHSHYDSEVYRMIIQSGIDGYYIDESDINRQHRIYQCYQYFLNSLESKYKEQSEFLFNKILKRDNNIFVVIDLDEKDDEQTIFDTLNNSGVRLSPADIIKNSIFKRAIQLMGENEAIRFYENTWDRTFSHDEDDAEYWGEEFSTGRMKRSNIEIVLHSVAIIKGFYNPDKNSLSELSKLYKDEISKFSTYQELREFLDEIISYSRIYKKNIIATDRTTIFSFENDFQRLIHILNTLEFSTFHPFILYVLKRYDDNKEVRDEITRKLEKFLVRRVVSRDDTRSFNKLSRDFIQDLSVLDTKLMETKIDSIRQGLRSISNQNATLLLFWIELKRRWNKKEDITDLKYTYSLEHIMPKKWNEFWGKIPMKVKENGTTMNDQEANADRDEKIKWIGNMTLLTSSLNTSLRNHTFVDKVMGDGKKKGMKSYSDLLITKQDVIEPFDRGDKIWDEDKIKMRQAKLEGEFQEIWGIEGDIV
jgi:uncharacterized protein with ParB-like and HNH nuclease domain